MKRHFVHCSILLNIILLFYVTFSSLLFLSSFSSFSSFFSLLLLNTTETEVIPNENILIFRSSFGYKTYVPASDSVHCFAKSVGYELIDVDLNTDKFANSACKEITDKNFLRHCVLAQYLNRSKASYALALDGDVAVINPFNTIQKYIDPYASLIFFERFRSLEIAACSYLVKNDAYGIEFLMDWARYVRQVPHVTFNNSDNGALLSLLLEKRSVASFERSICTNLWQRSNAPHEYIDYLYCVKVFLGAKRKNVAEKIKILRRGEAWMRDQNSADDYWCDNDFFFHEIKAEKYATDVNDTSSPYSEIFNVSNCRRGHAANNFHLKAHLKISCQELRKKLYGRIKVAVLEPMPYFRDDDLECWPHCDD